MINPKFFFLTIGMFAQYKYAWYEPYGKVKYSTECPKCPECGRAIGGLFWLPPYNVVLKQPRNIGDFITGPGGCNFLVSEKVLELYEKEKLTGIEKRIPITIMRMGTTQKAKTLNAPNITRVYICHSRTQEKSNEMGIIWMIPPKPDYCRLCGPGGSGSMRSRERIVVDGNTWRGEDIFYAINGSGVLLSEKAAHLFINHGLTNATIIPCEEAKFAYY